MRGERLLAKPRKAANVCRPRQLSGSPTLARPGLDENREFASASYSSSAPDGTIYDSPLHMLARAAHMKASLCYNPMELIVGKANLHRRPRPVPLRIAMS